MPPQINNDISYPSNSPSVRNISNLKLNHSPLQPTTKKLGPYFSKLKCKVFNPAIYFLFLAIVLPGGVDMSFEKKLSYLRRA
jgi:hypothetical protein